MMRVVPLLCVFALTGCFQRLRREDREHWRRLSSPQLVLTTDLDERDAQAAFEALSEDTIAIRAAFSQLSATTVPVRAVVFANRFEFDEYFGRLRAGGVAFEAPIGRLLVLFGGAKSWVDEPIRSKTATSTARHELAHVVSRDFFPTQPLWFAEGLATYLEPMRRLEVAGSQVVVFGGPHELRLAELLHRRSRARLVPLHTLLTTEGYQTTRQEGFYPTAWLLIHYLANRDQDRWKRFLVDLSSGVPVDEAMVQFRKDLDLARLDEQLSAYAREGKYQVSSATVEAPAVPTSAPLSECEWAEARAELLYHALRLTESMDAFTEASQLNPSDERAWRMLANSSLQEAGFLDRWREARPDSATAWLLTGLVSKDPGLVAEAKRKVDGVVFNSEELTSLALVLLNSHEPAGALALAQRALATATDLTDPLEMSAQALAQLGRWDEAIAAQEEALSRAHDAGDSEDLLRASLEQLKTHHSWTFGRAKTP